MVSIKTTKVMLEPKADGSGSINQLTKTLKKYFPAGFISPTPTRALGIHPPTRVVYISILLFVSDVSKDCFL
jgi:hypothetical protein